MLRWPFFCIVTGVLAVIWALPLSGAGDPPEEKLLFGFEDEDIQKAADLFKLDKKEGKAKDGTPYVSLHRPFLMPSPWLFCKGQASQGERALAIGGIGDPEKSFDHKVQVPPEAAYYYGLTNNNYAAIFNTCGLFRRLFPIDWSGHDLLRCDVYCHDAKQTIRIALEDEEIGPPVVRNFTAEPNRWTTLEVDLRAAAEKRGLDLKRMATLTIGVARIEGKVARTYPALIDNLRLARAKAAAKLPVVRDDSSLALPDYYRASSSPQPEKLPAGKPDHSPLPKQEPILIPTEKAGLVNPVGWVAAYDNQRLLVGYIEGNTIYATKTQVLQSLDGGKRWTGLDGGAKPTGVLVQNTDHGGGRGDVVGNRADVLVFSNLGCRGGGLSSLRLFSQKLTLTDTGWEVRPLATLVDCELRHCNSNQTIVRTADGRLWAAYGMDGRLGTKCIHVRYSDDDGVIWKSWAEGKSGAIPGTQKPDKDGGGFGYTFEEPCLVPFGKGIACLWEEATAPLRGQLRWSRFENGAWSAIETIEQPKRVTGNPTARPAIQAVSVRGQEIFLVSARFKGVLHFQGGKWSVEAEDVPLASRISVAGDKTVVVIAAVSEKGDVYKGPVTLQAWQRSTDGKWSGPGELAREETPLSNKSGGGDIYLYRPGFVVQPYAPPSFVPLAWTCDGQKWVKYLRVAVDAVPPK